MLAHISDASSCTVQLYIGTYIWCFIVYWITITLLAATLYQGNPDMNNHLWNIVSS